MDDSTKELIAIGASVACNCHPCVKFHTEKARQMAIDEKEIKQAVEVGKMVQKGAAGQMDDLLGREILQQ